MVKISKGMLVKYRSEWCEPDECKYVHVVEENLLSPLTKEMTRWSIRTVNVNMIIKPVSVVEDYMIEPLECNGIN